jgi:hypothetical protein
MSVRINIALELDSHLQTNQAYTAEVDLLLAIRSPGKRHPKAPFLNAKERLSPLFPGLSRLFQDAVFLS